MYGAGTHTAHVHIHVHLHMGPLVYVSLMCAYHVGQGEVEAVVDGVLVGGRLLQHEERVEEGVEAVLVRAHRAQLAAEARGRAGKKVRVGERSQPVWPQVDERGYRYVCTQVHQNTIRRHVFTGVHVGQRAGRAMSVTGISMQIYLYTYGPCIRTPAAT